MSAVSTVERATNSRGNTFCGKGKVKVEDWLHFIRDEGFASARWKAIFSRLRFATSVSYTRRTKSRTSENYSQNETDG